MMADSEQQSHNMRMSVESYKKRIYLTNTN